MVGFFKEFLKWWLIEIGELLRIDLLNTAPDATILQVTQDSLSLLIRKRGKTVAIGQVPAEECVAGAFSEMEPQNERPQYQVLWIPDPCIVKRHLSMPTAARENLGELLSYEIERETPFTKDEIYWGYLASRPDTRSQHLQVQLAVIPKATTEGLVELARSAGFEPHGFEMQLEGFGRLFTPFKERRGFRRPRNPRASKRLLLVTGALASAVVALPFIFQLGGMINADRQIAALEVDADHASTIRKSIDRLKRTSDILTEERRHTGSALEILAATSSLIPSDSYLVSLGLHKGQLTLTGLSPSAAKLITLFAGSPSFRDPAFVSPIVENESGGLETFTIALTPKMEAW